MWRPLKKSAMHHIHEGLNAEFKEQDGWLMPTQYKSVESEIEVLKKAVGIGDLSFNGKLNLKGRSIAKLFPHIFSNSVSTEIGEVIPTTMHDSKINCLVCNLGRDEATILTKAGEVDKAQSDLLTQTKRLEGCVHLTNVTSSQAGISLVGPFSPHVLMKMTDVDVALKKFPSMSCAQGGVARVPTIIIRNDVGSLPAFELYFSRELGEYMWEAVVEDGREFGINPFGINAREKAG